MARHSVLLGGLGGDSHSVGLIILRQALTARGFDVRYIGTQNRLETFWEAASQVNVVMVSCMDGHARTYLQTFPELRLRHADQTQPIWLLGGNPVVEDLIGGERRFIEMGFARVFLKFVDIEHVLDTVERLVADETPRRPPPGAALGAPAPTATPLTPGKLPRAALEAARTEVLRHWPTGAAAADLRENAETLRRAPNWVAAQAQVDRGEAPPIIQPRSGVAAEAGQVKLFEAFKSAGARVLSYQVDSYTRNNNYLAAQEGMKESVLIGYSTVNGFPVVNHGVPALRRIGARLGAPFQTRHSTRDPRLLAEISYAGGVTAYEGGPICYNIPYYKDYPVEEAIEAWRYVDRLTGLYAEEFGILIDREYFGVLTATLIPPCLAIATGVLEALLAAEQGVKAVSIGYAEQGARFQDVAAIRAIRPAARRVLDAHGHKDVAVSSVFNQYMAAFPSLEIQAEELIRQSAITATLSGATRIITKTPVEAFKIPSLADNLRGLALTRRGVADAFETTVDEAAVAEEQAVIERETDALIAGVLELGRGDVAAGVVAAFQTGALDIPFAPSIHNRGRVMCARDARSAIRFLDCGGLPFSREIKQFNAEAIQERRRLESRKPEQDYQMIEHDVMVVATGQYDRWPLHP